MLKYSLLAGILLAVAAACNLDPNEKYVPKTVAAFFLVEEGPQSRSILKIEDTSFLPGWQSAAGLEPSGLSDVSSREGFLWLASAPRRQVLRWDLEKDELTGTYSTPGFAPHYMCAGDRYLLLADTLQQQLGFFDKRAGKLTYQFEVSHRPGPAVYLSAKFFVSLSDSLVAIYQEQAFAPISQFALPAPFAYFQLDNSQFLFAYSQDTVLQSSQIDYNANSLDGSRPLPYEAIRLSPYLRQQVGTEWLQDLFTQEQLLYSGKDPTPLAEGVSAFETDFFSGRVYYQKNDTLHLLDLGSREHLSQFPWDKKIRKTEYYQNFVSE